MMKKLMVCAYWGMSRYRAEKVKCECGADIALVDPCLVAALGATPICPRCFLALPSPYQEQIPECMRIVARNMVANFSAANN